jgi:integration host factor subunit beta
MTKSELIAAIAARFPTLTLPDVAASTDVILGSITYELVAGGRVELRGFGSFSIVERPPRIGRNPKSGEKVQVPGKTAPHFKPGLELRQRVNKSHVV